MLELLLGSFFGVFGGYWSARLVEQHRLKKSRGMLLRLLQDDLMQVQPEFPPFEEGAAYHRHPITIPALDALLDGERLDGTAPYFLIKELTRLRTVSQRYDELIRVSNTNQPALLQNVPYQRGNYRVLKAAWEEVEAARADCLEAVEAVMRGKIGKQLLGRGRNFS